MAGEDKVNSELLRRFNSLRAAAAAEGINIGIGSGYRTVQEQINLRRTNGCPDIWKSPASSCRVPTAIPGQSNHNHGLAIDFIGNSAADAWVKGHADEYGLSLPVKGENWHLEMTDDDESRSHMHGGQSAGAMGFDTTMMEQENPEDELANRLHAVMRMLGQDAGVVDTAGTPVDSPEFPEAQFDRAIRPSRTSPTSAPTPRRSGTERDTYIDYARQQLSKFGWDESELPALIELWDRESDWQPTADNPNSTAHGIAQFLNGTWAGTGFRKTDDPYQQIDAGLTYIANRKQYGSPSRALSFHNEHNWY